MNQRGVSSSSSSSSSSSEKNKSGGFSVAPKMNARWHVGPAFDPREEEEEEAKRKRKNKNGGGGGGGDDDMSVSDDGNGKEKLAVRIFWASSWTIDRSNTGSRGIWINSDYAC